MPPPPEHKWLWLLMSVYILFLMGIVYIVKEDTRDAIEKNHKMIMDLVEFKKSHVIESAAHDRFARDNLTLLNSKIDILLSKADIYHHQSVQYLKENVLNNGKKNEPKTKSK